MILDLVCFLLSLFLACAIRLNNGDIHSLDTYQNLFIIIALIHICTSIFDNNYKGILRRGYMKEFFAIIRHIAVVFAVMLVLFFFLKASEDLSRLVIIYAAIISLFVIWIARTLWKKYIHHRLEKNPRLMLLATDLAGAERILSQFRDHMIDFTGKGIALIDSGGDSGFASDDRPEAIDGIPVVAGADTLLDYLRANAVDEILFSVPQTSAIPSEMIRQCSLMGITIHLEIISSDEMGGARFEEDIAGLAVMTSYLKLITPGQAFLKRAMDIAGGLVGVLLTGILFLFVAPAIYISDPGPIFFGQERVGKNGRIFKLYKFRSMYQDAEERKAELMEKNEMKGQIFKMENDPRIIGSGPDGTRHGIGHFISTTSIDEFPQFWNVLRGDMSLVGTRPPLIGEVREYDIHHRARLAVKPGLTGLWQVSGRNNIVDFEEIVKMDTTYIRDWSIDLDIKILFKTVAVVFARKGSK
ncbi:MAG: sugar transferase [Lachnospiraceae bacterium]|nr:sugar transferase [Lachnospiraceae bacterium]